MSLSCSFSLSLSFSLPLSLCPFVLISSYQLEIPFTYHRALPSTVQLEPSSRLPVPASDFSSYLLDFVFFSSFPLLGDTWTISRRTKLVVFCRLHLSNLLSHFLSFTFLLQPTQKTHSKRNRFFFFLNGQTLESTRRARSAQESKSPNQKRTSCKDHRPKEETSFRTRQTKLKSQQKIRTSK